jgi:hypothetical protein
VDIFCRTAINKCVKSLRIILTLVMVTLWPLVVSHCDLEQLPGLQFLACGDGAPDTPQHDDDCETDGCASLESGSYKAEDGRLAILASPVVWSAFLTATSLETERAAAADRTILDSAPPELPNVWQFASRTALPPRAPTFAS